MPDEPIGASAVFCMLVGGAIGTTAALAIIYLF